MSDGRLAEPLPEADARERQRPEAACVLAPIDVAGRGRSSENALAARASILGRFVGELGGRGAALRTLEVDFYSRSGKVPVVHLTATVGQGATDAEGAIHTAGEAPRGAGRQDATTRAVKTDLTGALADHSPLAWRDVPRSRRRQLASSIRADHVARLHFRNSNPDDRPLELYPLRASTIERAMQRARLPVVVRISVLAMPRRHGVELRPLTSSHTYGRLVPVGAPANDGNTRALRSDAAEQWQYLVRVEVVSRGEIPNDLLGAIAADIRGTGAGSIGIVLGGQAAAVEAEWQLGGLPPGRSAHDAGLPTDTVLLNLRETACLLALPSGPDEDEPPAARLARVPARLPRSGIVVGTIAGTRRPVAIPWADMFRHSFLIGATGSGKSTSQLNIILQAIRDTSQPAVIVLDPHGSLVDAIAGRLTPEEIDRVVWFDPSDPVAPMTWDPLADRKPATVDAVVSFAWEQWDPYRTMQAGMGPIAEQMMRAVLTTVMSKPGSTLADAFALIQDDDRIGRYLPFLKDRATHGFWKMRANMTGQQKGEFSNYLTSKVSPFAHDEILRRVLSPVHSTLDLPGVIANGQILLVSVRKAVVGVETTTMLVRLLKRFIWREITARGPGGPEQRRVLLAIDEFVDYQQRELDAVMLQAARKYHTSLSLATQNLAPIDPSLREAIAANAASLLAFRVGIYDGAAVSAMLGDQSIAAELTTMPNFRAVARIPVAGEPLPPVLIDASKPPKGFSPERLEEVRTASRARYGVPIEEAPAGTPAETPALIGDRPAQPGVLQPDASEPMALPATPAGILEILSAAGITADIDDEGDVRIVGDWPPRMYVLVEEADIRFYAAFRLRPRTSHSAGLDLANRINDNVRLVRAAVVPSGGDPGGLELDWYLPLEPPVLNSAIPTALRRFTEAVSAAIEADTRGILVTDLRGRQAVRS